MRRLSSYLSIAVYLSWWLLATYSLPVSAQENRHFPRGSHSIFIAKSSGMRTDLLNRLAPIIEQSIANGDYPGAVLLIGHQGKIVYRGVFGSRRILPREAPMRFDTVFDLASLTKILATAPAIMQLIEQNKLVLDAPVARYWPGFARQGKSRITIRELLTHTSGLPPEVKAASKEAVLREIEEIKPAHQPGTTFLYSDVNFITLQHLIELVSGEMLDTYVKKHIFVPLGMKKTSFLPPTSWKDGVAPTELIANKLRWGEVQDPLAAAMGGVSGAAGLFSTASDIGIYAQSLLDGGRLPTKKNKPGDYLLGPLTVRKMTSPQTPVAMHEARGLGFDLDSPYSNRGVLFSTTSFGHSGWTGTSLWIDPESKTWIIFLTSRAHPSPRLHNQVVEDRRAIANIVAASITDINAYQAVNTGPGELYRAYSV
ncbi:MAG: hypothetical protein A3F14_02540 [Gammaproteobacteria bacterium RIFCSPHIGHO2_12_FULL_43_28]|nr:MAG: hypothetical protein A3F14_02540 [Gammaproteobacteria bacterium RIFCSPHIGHO2_12_FULL_43_28]